MKKTLLFICAILLTSTTFAQNIVQLFNSANSFFDVLQEGKYTQAHAMFSDTLKNKLTEEHLKNFWEGLQQRYGKPKSFDAIQSKAQGEFFAVTVEGHFEKDDQNFIVGFDKAQKIVGLFLGQTQRSTAYIKPAYVDTSLYIEKALYIGPDKRQLAAMLTIPKNVKNFPVVVFVHGSGPGDMDETVGANKPFKDLATGLASKGIGSIRYVKRTLVYANEFTKPFTVKEEVLDDALAAIAVARTTQGADPKNIFVFGHSLGGMLAPRIATMAPDLAGLILAAAPARQLSDIIIDQNKYAIEVAGDTTAQSKEDLQNTIKEIDKSRITQLGTSIKPDSVILGLPAKYWADLNAYNQVTIAKGLTKEKMFIVQGGNDFQVSKTDFDLWNNALGQKKNVKLKFYPELNHLLSPQSSKGTLSQYQLPVCVSETLVNDLATWVKAK